MEDTENDIRTEGEMNNSNQSITPSQSRNFHLCSVISLEVKRQDQMTSQ